jgi:hypothetical protein
MKPNVVNNTKQNKLSSLKETGDFFELIGRVPQKNDFLRLAHARVAIIKFNGNVCSSPERLRRRVSSKNCFGVMRFVP